MQLCYIALVRSTYNQQQQQQNSDGRMFSPVDVSNASETTGPAIIMWLFSLFWSVLDFNLVVSFFLLEKNV